MKTGTLLKRWTVAFLAIVLSICLFAIPAFADSSETTADTTESSETTETTDESTAESTEEVTMADDTDETTADGTETTGTSGNKNDNNNKKGLSTQTIVWLIVAAAVVVIGAVLGIKFREKIGKFLRVYKSESKKIVWLPWDQTKKNTLIVIAVLLICAIAICLIDYALSKGILAFINLF